MINDNFFLEATTWPEWKILKNEIVPSADSKKLSYYDLVNVVIDDKGEPKEIKESFTGVSSYFVFTKPNSGSFFI